MNERDWAERFSHDVDDLLNEAGRADAEPPSEEYRQDLDLARTLATTDFSDESQMRQAVRRRLLNQIDARERAAPRKENSTHVASWRRSPAMIVTALILAGLLVVMLAWPGALKVAAQEIQEFVQRLVLGRHTEAVQVDPEHAVFSESAPPARPTVSYDDGWTIETSIGNFGIGSSVPPGQDVTVKRFDTIDEAQATVSFGLRRPGYLPAGYALREVMVAPTDEVFQFYGGPDGDIILLQTPVGEQRITVVEELEDGLERVTVQVDVKAIVAMTNESIEPVTLNGQPAGWIEGYGLMWEADDVTYLLGGINLSLDEAIRIAESLE